MFLPSSSIGSVPSVTPGFLPSDAETELTDRTLNVGFKFLCRNLREIRGPVVFGGPFGLSYVELRLELGFSFCSISLPKV